MNRLFISLLALASSGCYALFQPARVELPGKSRFTASVESHNAGSNLTFPFIDFEIFEVGADYRIGVGMKTELGVSAYLNTVALGIGGKTMVTTRDAIDYRLYYRANEWEALSFNGDQRALTPALSWIRNFPNNKFAGVRLQDFNFNHIDLVATTFAGWEHRWRKLSFIPVVSLGVQQVQVDMDDTAGGPREGKLMWVLDIGLGVSF